MTCHQEVLLDLNTDCVEFCPLHGNHQWLAVGTYQLDEATKLRNGRLYLYQLQHEGLPQLVEQAKLDVAGIFDLQWTQLLAHEQLCIGLALADGTLRLVQVKATDSELTAAGNLLFAKCNGQLAVSASAQSAPGVGLQQIGICQAVNTGMCLSLDWAPPQHQHGLAATSSSAGTISIVQVAESGITQLSEWQGHDLEAWMAHWDKHQPRVLYSGADDCAFKVWDTRTACSSSNNNGDSSSGLINQAAVYVNSKAHEAGVCCISSHPHRAHVLVTGSYDEQIRLWDTRNITRPVKTCQTSAGGGVWRLKWHPSKDQVLLAACMYNGVALVTIDEHWSTVQVTEEYKGHESIAYGADWCRRPCSQQAEQQQGFNSAAISQPAHGKQQGDNTNIIATCSFYDRRLHLWSPTIPI
eukprot:GHRR01013650.1.p1 GENE.GHRR01013650.1~~GHRR01013650.1.p1  ORF type:complete len:411 (+),score=102.83 GHRR01013650.1:717-1949(+)